MSFESYEAEVILTNFARRVRVHKEKVVNIPRLYSILTIAGHKLNKVEFDKVFMQLEQFGYGVIGKSKEGHLREFLPMMSIKQIGLLVKEHRLSKIELEDKVSSTGLVTVYFHINGKRCKALIPEDAIDAFEKMVYS